MKNINIFKIILQKFAGSNPVQLLGKSGGFTLKEIIIALVIVSVIASIAIPSVTSFIRAGQQSNRMNIARTIYLAAQSELTSMRLNRTLAGFSAGANEIVPPNAILVTPEEQANRAFLRYISTADATQPLVRQLLENTVLDRGILEHAIVIEFNAETGIVLSAFYSDDPLAIDFGLSYDAGSADTRNITGNRPYTDFGNPRWQGYYGVESTLSLPGVPLYERVRLFDGVVDQPLHDGVNSRINILYAEIFLDLARPDRAGNNNFTIALFNGADTPVLAIELADIEDSLVVPALSSTSFTSALGPLHSGIYYAGPDPQNLSLTRYVWIIDYIQGDLLKDFQPHSIAHNAVLRDNPQILQARVFHGGDTNSGTIVNESFTQRHTHFAGVNGSYSIRSARHLNNIRYAPADNNYLQDADINMREPMSDPVNIIGNFEPISIIYEGTPPVPFAGQYAVNGDENTGEKAIIRNLTIDTTEHPERQNVGLFAETSGIINGVGLFNAEITAPYAVNTGAITGVLGGTGVTNGTVSNSWSLASVTGSRTNADANTGGLVGLLHPGASLSQSFNAGFYRHDADPPNGTPTDTVNMTGSVQAERGYVGGLAGRSAGDIRFSFNNARVNVFNVHSLTPDRLSRAPIVATPGAPVAVGGIIGRNDGDVEHTYATNFVGGAESSMIGGISGQGDVAANNYYIENGTSHPRGATVTSYDIFRVMDPPSGDNIVFTEGIKGVRNRSNFNYSNYPYWRIAANNPFGNTNLIWGWEDILGEAPKSMIVYYELYSNETTQSRRWGFDPLAHQVDGPLFALESATGARVVENDGYCIEAVSNTAGYTVQIGASDWFRILAPSADEPVWRVRRVVGGVDTELAPGDAWIAPQTFIFNGRTHLRFFIPNHVLKRIWLDNNKPESFNPIRAAGIEDTINIRVFFGSGHVINPPTGQAVSPIEERKINPLFAYFETQGGMVSAPGGVIRSPRHLENIAATGNSGGTLNGTYHQGLNIDFAVYREELSVSGGNYIGAGSRVIPNRAVVSRVDNGTVYGTFTGTYSGRTDPSSNNNPRIIYNLAITASNVDNVGLFSTIGGAGRVNNVTMRNVRINITGGNNIGAIAGTNHGTIQFCSVQQEVNQAIPVPDHPVSVTGASRVGGIAGSNNGTILDVTVVSSSGVPAVSGTTAGTVGGILGVNNNSNPNQVNRMIYLAVSPATTGGTAANPTITALSPFTGSASPFEVGSNRYYLSGQRAIRPFPVRINNLNYTDYNFITLDIFNTRPEADNTFGIARSPLFTNWIRNAAIAGMTTEAITARGNTIYPYPYPAGTVEPRFDHWPIADTMGTVQGVVYYELYEDGTFGVFTRNFENQSNPAAAGYRYVDLDYLNPHGIILESGYATVLPRDFNNNSARTYARANRVPAGHIDPLNTGWTQIVSATGQDNYLMVDSQRFFVRHMDVLFIAIRETATNRFTVANPLEPFVIWVNSIQGGSDPRANPAGVAYINPRFAKAVYPLIPRGEGFIDSPVFYPNEHFIRTGRHMQNISDVTAYSAANPASATADHSGHRFILDRNIDLGVTRNIPNNLIPLWTSNTSNVATTFRPGFTFNSTVTATRIEDYPSNMQAQAQIDFGNFTTLRGTGTFGNIVRGTFNGTFEGRGYTISRFDFPTSNSTGGKGLFSVIEPRGTGVSQRGGIVENLTVFNCNFRNGSSNGTIASVNRGTIRNVSIVSSNPVTPATSLPVTGASAGGVVSNNSGTIENVLYIAPAPGTQGTSGTIFPISFNNTGTITNAFYLSGSISAINRPNLPLPAALSYNEGTVALGNGTPQTTQEINGLSRTPPLTASDQFVFGTSPWTPSISSAQDTMRSTQYPYPQLSGMIPTSWPVATIPVIGEGLVYYEEYVDTLDNNTVKVGIWKDGTDSLPGLNNPIIDAGYAVKVQRAGWYSVRLATGGSNVLTKTEEWVDGSYIRLQDAISMPSGIRAIPARDIIINDVIDVPVVDTRSVNLNYAKAIYGSGVVIDTIPGFTIRTPQQMRNIDRLAATPGLTFTLERNLDFSGINLNANGAVVTEDFVNIFEGGGYRISGLTISSSANGANVGLFSENSGTIRNITLDLGVNGIIAGSLTQSNVGAVAGSNSGAIYNISVVGANTVASSPISGTNAGGIVGENIGAGSISQVIFLARAPQNAAGDMIFPIAGTGTANANCYYLSGTVIPGGDAPGPAVEGFNTITSNVGTPGTTGAIQLAFSGWGFAPAPSLYPYPLPGTAPHDITSVPAAWLETGIMPIIAALFSLCECEPCEDCEFFNEECEKCKRCYDCSFVPCGDCDPCKQGDRCINYNPDKTDEPDEPDEPDERDEPDEPDEPCSDECTCEKCKPDTDLICDDCDGDNKCNSCESSGENTGDPADNNEPDTGDNNNSVPYDNGGASALAFKGYPWSVIFTILNSNSSGSGPVFSGA